MHLRNLWTPVYLVPVSWCWFCVAQYLLGCSASHVVQVYLLVKVIVGSIENRSILPGMDVHNSTSNICQPFQDVTLPFFCKALDSVWGQGQSDGFGVNATTQDCFFVLHAASPFSSFLMDAVSVSLRVGSIGPGRKTLIMIYSYERRTSKHLARWARRKNHPCRHQHRPECPYLLRPAGISLCLCHLCRSQIGLGNVLQIVCFHVTCSNSQLLIWNICDGFIKCTKIGWRCFPCHRLCKWNGINVFNLLIWQNYHLMGYCYNHQINSPSRYLTS